MEELVGLVAEGSREISGASGVHREMEEQVESVAGNQDWGASSVCRGVRGIGGARSIHGGRKLVQQAGSAGELKGSGRNRVCGGLGGASGVWRDQEDWGSKWSLQRVVGRIGGQVESEGGISGRTGGKWGLWGQWGGASRVHREVGRASKVSHLQMNNAPPANLYPQSYLPSPYSRVF